MDMRSNAEAMATEPGEREVQLQTVMTNNQLRELTKLQANEISLLEVRIFALLAVLGGCCVLLVLLRGGG